MSFEAIFRVPELSFTYGIWCTVSRSVLNCMHKSVDSLEFPFCLSRREFNISNYHFIGSHWIALQRWCNTVKTHRSIEILPIAIDQSTILHACADRCHSQLHRVRTLHLLGSNCANAISFGLQFRCPYKFRSFGWQSTFTEDFYHMEHSRLPFTLGI